MIEKANNYGFSVKHICLFAGCLEGQECEKKLIFEWVSGYWWVFGGVGVWRWVGFGGCWELNWGVTQKICWLLGRYLEVSGCLESVFLFLAVCSV